MGTGVVCILRCLRNRSCRIWHHRTHLMTAGLPVRSRPAAAGRHRQRRPRSQWSAGRDRATRRADDTCSGPGTGQGQDDVRPGFRGASTYWGTTGKSDQVNVLLFIPRCRMCKLLNANARRHPFFQSESHVHGMVHGARAWVHFESHVVVHCAVAHPRDVQKHDPNWKVRPKHMYVADNVFTSKNHRKTGGQRDENLQIYYPKIKYPKYVSILCIAQG